MRHVEWRECWLGPRDLLCGLVTQILQEFHGDTPRSVRQTIEAGNSRGIFLVYASRTGPVGISYLQGRSNLIVFLSPKIEAAERNIFRVCDLVALALLRGAANT